MNEKVRNTVDDIINRGLDSGQNFDVDLGLLKKLRLEKVEAKSGDDIINAQLDLKAKSESKESREHQIYQAFVDDGMDEKRAQRKYKKLDERATQILKHTSAQHELFELMVQKPDSSYVLNIDEAMEILPFLVKNSEYEIDVVKFVKRCLSSEDCWDERSKYFLRYFEILSINFSRDQIKELLLFFCDSLSKEFKYVALYAEKVVNYFSDDQNFIEELFSRFTSDLYLDVLSQVPVKKLPKSFLQKIEGWFSPDDPYIESDDIKPVRSIAGYAGTCPNLDLSNNTTLLGGEDRHPVSYGETVLLYVKGHLVGAVKKVGNQSLLAFENIKTLNGKMALVKGGAYAVPADVQMRVRQTEGKFKKIEVDSLIVFPVRFLDSGVDVNALANFKHDMVLLDKEVSQIKD